MNESTTEKLFPEDKAQIELIMQNHLVDETEARLIHLYESGRIDQDEMRERWDNHQVAQLRDESFVDTEDSPVTPENIIPD